MHLPEKIQELMDAKNLTAYRVSKDTGVPYTTLTKILNGSTRHPRVDVLQKIADYFNVPLDQLTKGTEESTPLNAPDWASSRDMADIKKILEEDQGVLFDGVPITDENRRRAMDVLTGLLWEAKALNKKTYGRKKKPDPKDDQK